MGTTFTTAPTKLSTTAAALAHPLPGRTPRRTTAGQPPHQVGKGSLLAVVVSVIAWAACGVAAYRGTVEGLRQVGSLTDLVGAATVTPSPVGPVVSGYSGVVIGDSRVARLGGPPPPGATPDDTACRRSVDSATAELALLRGTRVLDLACAGASIRSGLRGAQQLGDSQVASQVGRVKQVVGLEWVWGGDRPERPRVVGLPAVLLRLADLRRPIGER